MEQTDPVCRMKVDDKTAAGRSTHEGHDYYFCNTACKTEFDKEPGKYLKDLPPA